MYINSDTCFSYLFVSPLEFSPVEDLYGCFFFLIFAILYVVP